MTFYYIHKIKIDQIISIICDIILKNEFKDQYQ